MESRLVPETPLPLSHASGEILESGSNATLLPLPIWLLLGPIRLASFPSRGNADATKESSPHGFCLSLPAMPREYRRACLSVKQWAKRSQLATRFLQVTRSRSAEPLGSAKQSRSESLWQLATPPPSH